MKSALDLIREDPNVNQKFKEALEEDTIGKCDHCGEILELINGACEECWKMSDPEDFVPVGYYK